MSKMNDLAVVLDALEETGRALLESAQKMTDFAQAVQKMLSAEAEQTDPGAAMNTDPAPELPQPKIYTKEDVRSVLAGLAQDGYREESKALVRKYADGGSLTDVPPERYAELVCEAEEIGRGD